MTKTTLLRLLLAALAVATAPLLAINARAALGDIYETNDVSVFRFNPNGGTPATFATGLANPKGIVFDGKGFVYVADAHNNAIIRFNAIDGSGVTFASGLGSPIGLAFDQAGFLYESDASTGNVFKFVIADGTKTTFASGVGAPAGLAFDSNGNLFVADFAGGNIFKVTPDGTKTTFAGGLSFPAGLAVDASNNLFEADSGSNTIFKFAPDGSKTSFATGLNVPYGLAFEATGNLVEADHGSGSTLRFTPAGVQSTIFTSNFNIPQFLAVEPAPHQLLNLSTRGFVEHGEHVLIAGFIVGGNGPVGTRIVVRALGPSLAAAGVADPLADPTLEVRDSSGNVVAFNNNWKDTQAADISSTGLAPTDDNEAAIVTTLHGGSFTAVVRGVDDTIGTALVEVYNLQ